MEEYLDEFGAYDGELREAVARDSRCTTLLSLYAALVRPDRFPWRDDIEFMASRLVFREGKFAMHAHRVEEEMGQRIDDFSCDLGIPQGYIYSQPVLSHLWCEVAVLVSPGHFAAYDALAEYDESRGVYRTLRSQHIFASRGDELNSRRVGILYHRAWERAHDKHIASWYS